MKPKSVHWADHTWEELQQVAEAGAVVVVPFGSTEQHGPMLPVNMDIRIARKAATDGATVAAEQHGVPTLVLPTVPFGLALHHMEFAGTISFQPETYVTLVAEILGCVIQHGFRKIAVTSGHGGNVPGLQLAIKKTVHQAGQPVRIALFQGHRDTEFSRLRREIWQGQPSEGQPSIHASRSETSETLADRPDLVRRDRMVKPKLEVDKVPEWSWQTHELSETGAFGDPSMATPELGEKLWASWAQGIGLFIKRLWDAELPATP